MPRTKGAYSQVVKSDNQARLQAWQSMRIMRRFSRADLLSTATINRSNLEKYLKALIAVDIVRVAKPRVSGRPGSVDLLELVVNTGPKPPVPWKNGEVFDPNTNLVHYLEDVDDAVAGEPASRSSTHQHQEGGAQAGSVAGDDQPGAEGDVHA